MSEKLTQNLAEALDGLKQVAPEIKDLKTASGETKGRVEKIEKELLAYKEAEDKVMAENEILKTKQVALEEKLALVEKLLSRPQAAPETELTKEQKQAIQDKEVMGVLFKAAATAESKEMLTDLIHKGLAEASLERKTLATAPDSAGGYLIPTNYEQMLIDPSKVEIARMRLYANVLRGAKENVWPTLTSRPTAAFVKEGTSITLSDATFGRGRINTHRLKVGTRATREFLAQSFINPENLLNTLFGTVVAQKEGAAFISGVGVDEPFGIMNNADITSVNSGSASAITLSGLTSVTDLKDEYINSNTKYFMTRTSWVKVMLLLQASTASGVPALFTLGDVSSGRPSTLNGFPVVTLPGLDEEGANTYPVLFGDMKQAYTIYDREGIAFAIDPYTGMAADTSTFYMTKWTGGDVVVAEAVKKLKCSV